MALRIEWIRENEVVKKEKQKQYMLIHKWQEQASNTKWQQKKYLNLIKKCKYMEKMAFAF